MHNGILCADKFYIISKLSQKVSKKEFKITRKKKEFVSTTKLWNTEPFLSLYTLIKNMNIFTDYVATDFTFYLKSTTQNSGHNILSPVSTADHVQYKLTCWPKKRSADKFDSFDPSYGQFLIKL